MGIHQRPLRCEKENVPRQSRPWDNGAIPPPQSAPLADFFNAPLDALPPARAANRELKPPYEPTIPPPLAALPLPPKPPASHPRDDAVESVPAVGLCIQDDSPLPHLSRSRTSSRPGATTGDGAAHSGMSAFSKRGSVSFALPDAPPKASTRPRPQSKYHSIRLSNTDKLNFLPTSASFLDFNDDERLQKLDAHEPAQNAVWHGLSFDEADSFSTFGTLPVDNNVPPAPMPPCKEEMPRPDSNESDVPPVGTRAAADDDDGALDVAERIVSRPGASDALKELQRASVTAGRELACSLRAMAEAEKQGARKSAHGGGARRSSASQAQGELMMRSRMLRRWNVRYASIVHQGYFGAVLLLFRPETRGVLGHIALRNSKMIALGDTTVRRVQSRRRNAPFMFEVRTSQRTYTFGCQHAHARELWVQQLSLPRAR